MGISAGEATLSQIQVDRIDRNPDNPRLVFRPGELAELQESIRVYGVQVPIAVYKHGKRYVLIDGERRWRCALKLNLQTIPALIQSKPGALENLLLMFNIHALREQWDLLTIALKLPRVVELLVHDLKRNPTEAELSEKSGLNRSTIRRCKLLMELPQEYKDQILEELKKPKAQQKITEDLFIEMERALKTVERALPGLIQDKDKVRRILLAKYRRGVINNRVHFRLLAKIARAERVGFDLKKAAQEIRQIFASNSYSIEAAYLNSVGEAYKERDIATRIETLLNLLADVAPDDIEEDVKAKLHELTSRISELFGDE